MVTPAFSTVVEVNDSSITATLPAGVADGHRVVMVVAQGDDDALTYPAGWTVEDELSTSLGGDRRLAVLSIVHGASTPALTVTAVGTKNLRCQTFSAPGADLDPARPLSVAVRERTDDPSPTSNDGDVLAYPGDHVVFASMIRDGVAAIASVTEPAGSTLRGSSIDQAGTTTEFAVASYDHTDYSSLADVGEWTWNTADSGSDGLAATVVLHVAPYVRQDYTAHTTGDLTTVGQGLDVDERGDGYDFQGGAGTSWAFTSDGVEAVSTGLIAAQFQLPAGVTDFLVKYRAVVKRRDSNTRWGPGFGVRATAVGVVNMLHFRPAGDAAAPTWGVIDGNLGAAALHDFDLSGLNHAFEDGDEIEVWTKIEGDNVTLLRFQVVGEAAEADLDEVYPLTGAALTGHGSGATDPLWAGLTSPERSTSSDERIKELWFGPIPSAPTDPEGTAALTAEGTFAATGQAAGAGTAGLDAAATFAADGQAVATGAADLTADATFAAAGQAVAAGDADMAAQATFEATGQVGAVGAADLTADATFAATGQAGSAGVTASILAEATFAAAGDAGEPPSADLTAEATFAAAGQAGAVASADLTAEATFAAAGAAAANPTAAMTAEVTFAAAGQAVATGSASMQADATLAANGQAAATGTAITDWLATLLAAGNGETPPIYAIRLSSRENKRTFTTVRSGDDQ